MRESGVSIVDSHYQVSKNDEFLLSISLRAQQEDR